MPILPPEPHLFPEDLLESAELPADTDRRWWVLHSRPRAEKALARRAREQSVPFFLPLERREPRGRAPSSLPLFPGYVFLYGTPEERVAALKTNLVVNCLPVEDQARLQRDLHGVYRLTESRLPLCAVEDLRPGDPVRVIRGTLAGLEGKVLRKGTKLNFIIEVRMLNRGVSVEIASWMLCPAENPRPVLV
ncbi:MAG TPA: transcription termination/antitermination NusG family protein [Gemmataceae bacterium]